MAIPQKFPGFGSMQDLVGSMRNPKQHPGIERATDPGIERAVEISAGICGQFKSDRRLIPKHPTYIRKGIKKLGQWTSRRRANP